MKVDEKNYRMVGKLAGCLFVAESRVIGIHNWTVDLATGKTDVELPDVLFALSQWGVAASIIDFIHQQDKQTQAKIWAVRPDLSPEELKIKLHEIKGYFHSIDTTDTELLESRIDRQLELELEGWQSYLAAVKPADLEEDDDDDLTKMSMERDYLEYAAIAIEVLRAEYPFFRKIQNLEKFLKGLEDSDVKFRQILGNRRSDTYHWADPVLWWRKPAK